MRLNYRWPIGFLQICVVAGLISLLVVQFSLCSSPASAEARFSNYEIRVIRPRFFSKENQIEVGAGLMSLTNQSFVYSMLAYGSLSWHFSETLAIELLSGYGKSFDKADKGLLSDTFSIDTILLRTESVTNGRLIFTPAYGKMDLSNGEMLYFDIRKNRSISYIRRWHWPTVFYQQG